MKLRPPVAFFPLVVAFLGAATHAQTTLTVTRGWGGKDRAARWNPVLVRAAGAVPRNVTLQLLGPQPGGFATILEERIAIGPAPATFELLAPSYNSPSERTVAVMRETDTGKIVAQFPPAPRAPGNTSPDVPAVGSQSRFVGLTGTPAALERPGPYLGAQFSFLAPHLLPRNPLGFDALDVLFLNRPNPRTLDADQQRAIVAWVRAGGAVLLSPGDNPFPADAPLASMLPCTVGDPRAIELSPQALRAAHLPARYARLVGRTLAPAAGARPLPLLDEASLTAYVHRVGLGQVMVVPVDVAALQFEETDEPVAVPRFWEPILGALVRLPEPGPPPKYAAPFQGKVSESPEQFHEGAAAATLCDFLAPAPAKPARWWPRAVLAMLVVCFVLGPIDSVALRMVGQPHWTLTTASGWIFTLALAVVYAGAWERSSSPALAGIRLIDQLDNAGVATTDLVSVEGGSQRIDLSPSEPEGWWEPIVPGSTDVKSAGFQPDVSFHVNDAGCVPEPLWPATLRPRFFRRQNLAPAPPVIQVALSRAGKGAAAARLIGTIRNVSQSPLKDVRIRTAQGVVPVQLAAGGSIAPGESVSVNIPLAGEAFSATQFSSRYQNFGYFGARTSTAPVREADLWAVVPDLAARRSLRIDALLESEPDLACVYAQSADPAPTVQIGGGSPQAARQYQWVRALTSLAR